jgi:hypothetical protein
VRRLRYGGWVAAVRAAAQPAPAPPGSRPADLLKVSNEVLFPSGSGKAGHGQIMTANAEALISSYRPFLLTVPGALRSHAPLLPAATLLHVHDPWPAPPVTALRASPLTAAEDAHLLNFLCRAMPELEKGILGPAITGYSSESPAECVTQGRRLLAHAIALLSGTRLRSAAGNIAEMVAGDVHMGFRQAFYLRTVDGAAILRAFKAWVGSRFPGGPVPAGVVVRQTHHRRGQQVPPPLPSAAQFAPGGSCAVPEGTRLHRAHRGSGDLTSAAQRAARTKSLDPLPDH